MATAGELHPTEGMRLLLERVSVAADEKSAVYKACIYTPTESIEFRATLDDSGGALLELISELSADEGSLRRLVALAKSTARAAERKRSDGLPPWPERVLRWRGPGRG